MTIPVRATWVFASREGRWVSLHLHLSAPMPTQEQGRSFPTPIEALASAVNADRPDLQAQAAPDGTITVLFSDIEDSSLIAERLGDQKWLELLRGHNKLVRDQLRAHDGFEVKTIGDGFMAVFRSARKAIQCSEQIQRALAGYNEVIPDDALRVRIGIHAG